MSKSLLIILKIVLCTTEQIYDFVMAVIVFMICQSLQKRYYRFALNIPLYLTVHKSLLSALYLKVVCFILLG